MQPQDYLHVVKLSCGWWAACCEGCAATVAICASKPGAYQWLTGHLGHAPSVPKEASAR
jgi:hypothetical protein